MNELVAIYPSPMTEHTENLVLEHLRAIRGTSPRSKAICTFWGTRGCAGTATLITMIPTYNDELEKLRKRVSRIERRLELTD